MPIGRLNIKRCLGLDVFAEGAFEEYEGYFDATDQKFVFDKGGKFFPNYEVTELETQIEFTPADWISKMKKIEDYGWIDENGQPVVSSRMCDRSASGRMTPGSGTTLARRP